jgi:hypothetical protein
VAVTAQAIRGTCRSLLSRPIAEQTIHIDLVRVHAGWWGNFSTEQVHYVIPARAVRAHVGLCLAQALVDDAEGAPLRAPQLPHRQHEHQHQVRQLEPRHRAEAEQRLESSEDEDEPEAAGGVSDEEDDYLALVMEESLGEVEVSRAHGSSTRPMGVWWE